MNCFYYIGETISKSMEVLNYESVQSLDGYTKMNSTIKFSKEKLKKEGIEVSQFRWKKMIKILKFLATTRQEAAFKKLTLS